MWLIVIDVQLTDNYGVINVYFEFILIECGSNH